MPRVRTIARFSVVLTALGAAAVPGWGHHSFAMYDRGQVIVFTGVVSSVEPDTNHLLLNFAPMNEQRDGVLRDAAGEPILWGLEMQAASAVARYGITPTEFPPGTIFSGAIYPARSGGHTGTQVMGEHSERVLFKCPGRTRPEAGKHCDSVAGSTTHGTATALPEATDSIEGR
jgi:Family of unknown function (DUF6152)